MAGWLQKLQQHNFDVEHRAGKHHGNADALSRRPCDHNGCRYCEKREVKEWQLQEEDYQHSVVSTAGHQVRAVTSDQPCFERIGQVQRSDPEIRCMTTWLEESLTKPEWLKLSSYSTAVKSYWGQWEVLTLHEGRLYRIVDNDAAQRFGNWLSRKYCEEQSFSSFTTVPQVVILVSRKHWLKSEKDYFGRTADSLLADVVILTPSDKKLTSAYPSAKLNSATSTNQNLPSKFWKVTSVDLGAE